MRKFDPFGNMQNMMSQFRRFMQNPVQLMIQEMGIPEQFANDPDGAIQYLVSNCKISQEQYNDLQKLSGLIQNNPMFQKMMK